MNVCDCIYTAHVIKATTQLFIEEPLHPTTLHLIQGLHPRDELGKILL